MIRSCWWETRLPSHDEGVYNLVHLTHEQATVANEGRGWKVSQSHLVFLSMANSCQRRR